MDSRYLESWVGKTETHSDVATARPVAALSATLDREDPAPAPGDPVPPLWHWLYFLPLYRQSELGSDGHARRGGFLPPVPLPHRMWAGGSVKFHRPICIGETLTRESKITAVRLKEGRSGPLVFVTVRHDISNADGLAVSEDQDLVYRGQAKPGAKGTAETAPGDRTWERVIRPDDVLLFRYSALTFNTHRIHYDRRYATEAEGYPGLVVHGPLIATLLMDLVRTHEPSAMVRHFGFRAVSPLFDTGPFRICGRPDQGTRTIALWAENEHGTLAMTAACTLD